MSIQDINFLKDNSKISTHKYHFCPANNSGVFNFPNDEILNNVFTLHILSAKCNTDTVLEISGNDINMDSMQLFATNDIVYNTTGLVYEKVVHPLAKLNSISYNFSESPTNLKCYITFIARNYEPNTNFNQNMYNDLNPAYNPHIIPDSSGSDEDTDETDDESD